VGPAEEQDFRKEAILLLDLHNTHIVRMLDYGITDARPFLVMNWRKRVP